MPISVEDVKLMASQRLTDTDDGGGRMTGNEIVDGNVNNLFPDISRLDRVYGRVSLRKAFVAVQTADNDTYNGAHVILSVPAQDPNVSVCLFSTNDPHDERTAARDRIGLDELTDHMAGGAELTALKHELAQVRGVDVEGLPEEKDLQAPVPASPEGNS